jgi:hypothetical protein
MMMHSLVSRRLPDTEGRDEYWRNICGQPTRVRDESSLTAPRRKTVRCEMLNRDPDLDLFFDITERELGWIRLDQEAGSCEQPDQLCLLQ